MSTRTLLIMKMLFAIILAVSLSGCANYSREPNRISSKNSAIVLTPEPAQGRDISNVNGSVIVGSGMRVNDVSTVNGRVVVESGAIASNLETVNGRVVIEESSIVLGDVDTVNGRIHATSGGDIGGSASTVNGKIELSGVSVGHSIKTENGAISLFDVTVGANVESRHGDIRLENSIVERDLVIHRKRSGLLGLLNWRIRKVEVFVGPGSEIRGNLIAREDIRLFIHESASVNNVIGADPLIYSGMRP